MSVSNDAAVCQVFGLALRQLRTQAGLSLRALDQAVHYNYSRLSRAENGHHLVDPMYVPAIDAAVGGSGLLVLLRSLASGEPHPADPTTPPTASFSLDDGDSVRLEIRTPDARTVRVSLNRREFAQLLTTGALHAVLPAGVVDLDQAERMSSVLHEPSRTDPQILEYFGTLLEQHFTADKMLGPRQMLTPVMAQIDVLDELRRHSRPGTTEPALRLLAQYAEFAGWLHQDVGDIPAAMYWSDRASQWSQAVGDYQMVAYMLIRKSNIALLNDNGVDAIELAAAAQKVPGALCPRLIALASQQEARGWALHGDIANLHAKLDIAADLLQEHPDDVDETAPVYLRHYSLDTLEEQAASCYSVSGQAEAAVAILERKIANTPQQLYRDRGHQSAKLANALLATVHPDPEQAISIGLKCITVARGTGSARIAKELNALNRTLTTQWPSLPDAARFREALAAYT